MTLVFQEISLALEQLGGGRGTRLLDRNAQYRPLTDLKRYKGPKMGVQITHFAKFLQKIGSKYGIPSFFFSNIRVETKQIFQRPEKRGVEMREHMSGMRLFSF